MNSTDMYSQRVNPSSLNKRRLESGSKLNTQRFGMQHSSKKLPVDVQKNILNYVNKANDLVKKINEEISRYKKNSQKTLIQQLRGLQEQIYRKNTIIRQLQSDINSIKNGQSKPKNKNDTNEHYFTQQIQNHSTCVIELKKQLHQKKKILSQRQSQVKNTFQKYLNKCQGDHKQIMRYAKFKDQFDTRKKELTRSNKNKFSNLNNYNIGKRHNSIFWDDRKLETLQMDKTNKNSPIVQLINKKNVAEAALRNEKKKHKQQMQNWISKLEFLQGEDDQLNEKIRLKVTELTNAERRFSESRNILQPELQKPKRLEKLKTS